MGLFSVHAFFSVVALAGRFSDGTFIQGYATCLVFAVLVLGTLKRVWKPAYDGLEAKCPCGTWRGMHALLGVANLQESILVALSHPLVLLWRSFRGAPIACYNANVY